MSLANPEFLLLLLLLPLPWAVNRIRGRLAGLPLRPSWLFANFLALRRTGVGWRARLAGKAGMVRVVALALLIVALARPQTEDWETLMGAGIDIMLCLDMSGSMNAVDRSDQEIADFQGRGEEPPSRFEVARETLKQFVRNRRGDRIGLVVFASQAYLKFPLTLDHETVIRQLDTLVLDSLERDRRHPGCINGCTINGEQTAIGDALAKAYKRLEQSDGSGKLIVLITDGNDNASKLKPLDVASHIGEQSEGDRPGLYTFLIGGGPQAKMPVSLNGRLARQHGFLFYQPYQEQVDEARLKELAQAAGGLFHAAYDEEQFRAAFESLTRSERLERKVAHHQDHFPLLLAIALALLGLEFALHVLFLRRYP